MVSTTVGGGAASGESTTRDKVRRIFELFDANGDGGLDRTEMAALVAAVNPTVTFTADQVSAILDEVFTSYSDFITDPSTGLSLHGLLRTYGDGAGDVDRDFAALGGATAAPTRGTAHDATLTIVRELESLIRASSPPKDSIFADWSSETGWSAELAGPQPRESRKRPLSKATLRELRARVDRSSTSGEAFDGHMAMGRILYDRRLFSDALDSFCRAANLRPADARPHFRTGNALCSLGRLAEAKASFLTALESAESDATRWSTLLPQIHINLGIAMESEGLLINASEHYREAAILCPTHYRALKLLGSAMFGIGENGAAKKALEEAVLLKPDYADAQCDLGSVLHAMEEDEGAVLAFQTAIDLNPGHLDALYNLGCLFKDVGRHQRAAEMFGRVLAIQPDHWRAQINRAASLLGAGEAEEAKKTLAQAFKMTHRVELYDAILQLKHLQRMPKEGGSDCIVVHGLKFKQADKKTTDHENLSSALWIRELQKTTKLGRCDVRALRKEMEIIEVPHSYNARKVPERLVRKADLELILRKLLHSLKPETFQGAVKAISEKIWSVLDVTGSGKVDLGMFFAILAPICAGPSEKRKRAAFDALLWRPVKDEGRRQLGRMDAFVYMRYLRFIYLPSRGLFDLVEFFSGEEVNVTISFSEFLVMFDDMDSGFGIMRTLVKLEACDRVKQGRHSCRACRYRITGLIFRETTSRFYLCSRCYSEGMIPSAFEKEEYIFKECRVK